MFAFERGKQLHHLKFETQIRTMKIIKMIILIPFRNSYKLNGTVFSSLFELTFSSKRMILILFWSFLPTRTFFNVIITFYVFIIKLLNNTFDLKCDDSKTEVMLMFQNSEKFNHLIVIDNICVNQTKDLTN